MKRWDALIQLLSTRPRSVGAEIGVFEGDTTARVLSRFNDIVTYYAVDSWKHYPEHTATLNPKKAKFYNADFKDVFSTFVTNTHKWSKKLSILNMMSEQAAQMVPDESLDWVFIDANHAYDFVKRDIELWTPKVVKGGLICGHDFGVKGARRNFGVDRSVREAFSDFGVITRVWFTERIS